MRLRIAPLSTRSRVALHLPAPLHGRQTARNRVANTSDAEAGHYSRRVFAQRQIHPTGYDASDQTTERAPSKIVASFVTRLGIARERPRAKEEEWCCNGRGGETYIGENYHLYLEGCRSLTPKLSCGRHADGKMELAHELS
jgi:hypothetical protein